MPTIGVAVPVPEPWGSLLRRYRHDFGDPAAATVPTHVTLLPPQEVGADELDEVHRKLEAATTEHPCFTMRLRGTGTFRPVSPVVFVAVSEGISSTELLAKSVRSELLTGELEFPFHPHVTVAHLVDDTALDRAFETLSDFECRFDVDAFSLYHHDAEAGWIAQRQFPLR